MRTKPGRAHPDAPARTRFGEPEQVVYADALPDVAVAAQATPDGGMRALVVIDGPQAPTEFKFPMTVPAGASLVPSPDGGVSVIAADGAPVAQITAPWAYDANGTAVPTSYRVEGTTLIQTVAHVGTAYPVVADPSFSVGWTGLFVRWSRSEALWLTGLTLAMTGTAVGAMCAGPHIVLCAAAVGGIWYVTHSLTDWAVGKLYDRGCRLETRIVPFTSTYVKC